MLADALLDMLASACVAPPLRWLWARYWPAARAYLRDLFDGFDEPK